MHWIALILAVLALLVFIAAHFAVPRKWVTIPLGLALLTAAWILHAIIATTDGRISIH